MKSLILDKKIPPLRDGKFNDKSTDVLLPFRYKDENSSHLISRWSLVQKCLLMLTISCCLMLTSCNGSGGGSAGGGIDGTGIMSSGAVSAFGSIIVNGTEFDTSDADIIINGEKIGEGDDVVRDNLNIGQIVTVEGRISADGNSTIADRVIYTNNVAGLVENITSIDDTTKEIVVLGQTVIVNVITKFEPVTYTFDSIAIDDVVEVSGYLDDNRVIRATFIENIMNIVEFDVTGFIENLVSNSKTFQINDLTVNYSRMDSSDLPEDFRNELFVEVGGVLDELSGELIATAIELADESDSDEVDDFEIMGFVTEIISENDIIKFKVGNQEVHADADPDIVAYVDGDPSDIVLGQKLEAEGSLVDGILIADEVEFWEPDQIEIEGIVDEVVFIGEFPEFTFKERDDQVFLTNEDTEFEDVAKEDIEVGIMLEVKGVPQDIDQIVIQADKVTLELE
jgi:hypothetical protein